MRPAAKSGHAILDGQVPVDARHPKDNAIDAALGHYRGGDGWKRPEGKPMGHCLRHDPSVRRGRRGDSNESSQLASAVVEPLALDHTDVKMHLITAQTAVIRKWRIST